MLRRQEKFIEEYQEIKSNLSSEDGIYFMDAVHPQHNSVPAFGWIKKGICKHLKSNTGRQRINLNGAINLENKDVFLIEDERINSHTVIKLSTY